jgi:hypothetical protein
MAVWNQPEKVDPATEQFGQAQGVATDMMSGAAFDPYRAANREAMARATAQKRASVANQINSAGIGGQGLGMQFARSTENDLMAQRFTNQLETAKAEQAMRQQGAGLGLNLEQQMALENQNAAQNRLAQGQLSLQSRAQDAAEENSRLANERANLDRWQSQEDARTELDYKNKVLNLQRELGLGELDISRSSLAQQKELALGEQDISRSSLAQQKELALGEQGISRQSLATQKAIADENAAIQREQIANNFTVAGRQLDLAMKTQSATELFQTAQLAYQNKALDAESKARMEGLKFQYDQLASQDKNLLDQINLGREQLTTQDKQFMAQLGLSEKAQEWAMQNQNASLALQNKIADINDKFQNAQLDINDKFQNAQLAQQGVQNQNAYDLQSRAQAAAERQYADAIKQQEMDRALQTRLTEAQIAASNAETYAGLYNTAYQLTGSNKYGWKAPGNIANTLDVLYSRARGDRYPNQGG